MTTGADGDEPALGLAAPRTTYLSADMGGSAKRAAASTPGTSAAGESQVAELVSGALRRGGSAPRPAAWVACEGVKPECDLDEA
jgi:hypothetical protein